MEPLQERLALIDRHVGRLRSALEQETGVSPVFRAVASELIRKAERLKTVDPADARAARETLVEVEQAADSAKVAAAADAGAGDELRRLAVVAHDALCLLKHDFRGA